MNEQRVRFDAPNGLFADVPSLAHAPSFDLGPIRVEPALRRLVSRDGQAAVVEPLVMQVLIALADAKGEPCSRDDLVTQCWGRRIVGDDAVNRVISRLRRDLAATTGDAVTVETIPKVGYRLRVPEGAGASTGNSASPEAASSLPTIAKRLVKPVLAAGAALAAAGALFVWQQPAAAVPVAIAIESSSDAADADAARFAGDVATDVARLTGAATRVSFVEPGALKTPADMLIRVSMQRDGSLLTSGVRLVDTNTSAVIWSQDYEDATGSGKLLREKTAIGIAGVVRCGLERLAGELSDPVSVRLYFAACDAADARDWPRARSFAQQLVARNPNASSGWACLALTTISEAAGDPQRALPAARQATGYAQKALAIDPHSGLAYQALAAALFAQGRPTLDVLEKGIAADPDHAGLQARYSFALGDAGYTRAAVEPALRAVALAPNGMPVNTNAVRRLRDAGRIDEALAQAAELERLWGDRPAIGMLRASMLDLAPDAKGALAAFKRSPPPDKDYAEMLAPLLEWRADPARFDWSKFDRMAEHQFADYPPSAWSLALLATRMHDRRRAMEWLTRAPTAYKGGSWSAVFAADAGELRRDRRFFDKMNQLGLVALWRKRGQWPDFCSEPGLGYNCKAEAARLASAAR